MPRSGEEIQAALAVFASRWKDYQGTERAEAQTFLNELFACYGTDRNAVGAKLEDFTSSAGFMDLRCLDEQIGLTTLYNAMDEGAWADLKKLHEALDESVAACYGWPRSVAQNDVEIVRRLTTLNQEITAGQRTYDPFGAAAGGPT